MAVHASELVVKPDFQILRRYRRPLLLRLEHTHRPTLEDYVHRATRLGSSRSLNLRIGITPPGRLNARASLQTKASARSGPQPVNHSGEAAGAKVITDSAVEPALRAIRAP